MKKNTDRIKHFWSCLFFFNEYLWRNSVASITLFLIISGQNQIKSRARIAVFKFALLWMIAVLGMRQVGHFLRFLLNRRYVRAVSLASSWTQIRFPWIHLFLSVGVSGFLLRLVLFVPHWVCEDHADCRFPSAVFAALISMSFFPDICS